MIYWKMQRRRKKAKQTEPTTFKEEKYHRVGTISVDHAFQLIEQQMKLTRPPKLNVLGYRVTVEPSLRLKCFYHKGVECSHPDCTRKGSFFALERYLGAKDPYPYHLNLWGVDEDGTEFLMTHDHTLARGLGGSNTLENVEPMCKWHNFQKSIEERELYNARNL